MWILADPGERELAHVGATQEQQPGSAQRGDDFGVLRLGLRVVLAHDRPCQCAFVPDIEQVLVLGLLVYRSIAFSELPKVLYDSARFAAISLFCIGTASAFGWALAYFQVPRAMVGELASWGLGSIGTGMIVALAFLVIGMFIDAIPAIIILGTVLWPVAQTAGLHPIHFAMIGIISLAFGLVTPPYGLCLLIACSIGQIKVVAALRNVTIILVPMVLVLTFVILLPDVILALPRWLLPRFVN